MKLNLNVAYKKLPGDIKSAEALTRILIIEAVTRQFPQGLPKTEARIYGKLLDAFYDETPEIEIEDSCYFFIKDALNAATLPANMSSWRCTLIDYLEAVKNGKRES